MLTHEKSIGIMGLGKMGKNIALRLLNKGYKVVAYNRSPDSIEEVKSHGAVPARSIAELVEKAGPEGLFWMMLPAGEATENAISELYGRMQKGGIIIDGSNSRYTDAISHYERFKSKGVEFIDAGCSGGPDGALNGMSIMVGGSRDAFYEVEHLFRDLSVEEGYAYMGGPGSGHFVKMVHNAIEYGMMQSIAEGLEMLSNGPYRSLDTASIFRLWDNGSVIRGNLIEKSERILSKDPKLESIEPYVEDTGEGRWAAETALEFGIPFTAIAYSLFERFSSRNKYHYTHRFLAALRHEFGGHKIKKK